MKKGFTLIELLVVMAILGILMAMMIPAASLVLRRTKISQAKTDAIIVTTVFGKYYAEYNRWPGYATNSEPYHLTDNVWVNTMSPESGTGFIASNPKRILFFEAGAGALDQLGFFVDPWGKPFAYQVDADGDGVLSHPGKSGDDAKPFRANVIVWSAGPDGDYSEWADNVLSWE